METVSIGDNLHEMSKPVFWENKKNISKYHLLKFLKSAKLKVPSKFAADDILIFFLFFFFYFFFFLFFFFIFGRK